MVAILLVLFSFTSYVAGYMDELPREIMYLGFIGVVSNPVRDILGATASASVKTLAGNFLIPSLLLIRVGLVLIKKDKPLRRYRVYIRRKFWYYFGLIFWTIFSYRFFMEFFGGASLDFILDVATTGLLFWVVFGFVGFYSLNRLSPLTGDTIITRAMGSIYGRFPLWKNYWAAIITLASLLMFNLGGYKAYSDIIYGGATVETKAGDVFNVLLRSQRGLIAFPKNNDIFKCVDEIEFAYLPDSGVERVLFSAAEERSYSRCR